MAFYRLVRDDSGEPRLERRSDGWDPAPTGDWWSPPVQDHLSWTPEGGFFVGKRRDGAVQVAGINVRIGDVQRVLCEHPDVADAAVRLMSAEEGGAEPRLKAFVVPRRAIAPDGPEAQALAESLRRHCAMRLHAEACPARYTFGPALPVTETGKPADWS
jgi:4-coumarate--CoA ligase